VKYIGHRGRTFKPFSPPAMGICCGLNMRPNVEKIDEGISRSGHKKTHTRDTLSKQWHRVLCFIHMVMVVVARCTTQCIMLNSSLENQIRGRSLTI
jgi:hypothetical protein